MATAAQYANCSWYCSASNASTYWNDYTPFVGTWRTGVAYNWGGMDSVSQFQTKINQGVIAGTTLEPSPPRTDFAGVDCSGFVLRCWGFTTHDYSTSTLHLISTQISWTDLKRGDVVNLAGAHVRLFDRYDASNGDLVWIYEATGGAGSGVTPARVVYRSQSKGAMVSTGYVPRRYSSIEEAPPPTVTISSPCSSSCASSTSPITVSGTASDTGGPGLDYVIVLNYTNSSWNVQYVSGASAPYSVSGINLQTGPNDIYAFAYDTAGNGTPAASAPHITVSYNPPDTTPPIATISSPCFPSCSASTTPITVSGNANDSGGSGLDYVIVLNYTTSQGNASASLSGNSAPYSVSGINLVAGSNEIYAFAYDKAGNQTSAATAQHITIIYSPPTCSAPTARCRSVTANLQSSQSVTVTADEANDGSQPGGTCSVISIQVSKDGTNFADSVTFGCGDLDNKTVTLKVTQSDGQTDTCTATVTVADPGNYCAIPCSAPTAICRSITTNIQPSQSVTVNASDVDNGSHANGTCTLSSVQISKDGTNFASTVTFGCGELGRDQA